MCAFHRSLLANATLCARSEQINAITGNEKGCVAKSHTHTHTQKYFKGLEGWLRLKGVHCSCRGTGTHARWLLTAHNSSSEGTDNYLIDSENTCTQVHVPHPPTDIYTYTLNNKNKIKINFYKHFRIQDLEIFTRTDTFCMGKGVTHWETW